MKLKNDKTNSSLLVIGLGNEFRGDDGIGINVVRSLQKFKIPNLTVKEMSGEGAALIDAWQGFENVIIIDAVASGAVPGTIFKINATEKKVPAKFFHYSTHAFSISEAIELARILNKLPQKIFIFGIEGKNFKLGTDISLKVKNAEKKVVDEILKEIL